MNITQKNMALQLLHDTLYRKQSWSPSGSLTRDGIILKTATTKIGNFIVTLDYSKNIIMVNRKRQRLPKAVATDLLNIVRLKIAKNIKKYASRNRTN